MHGLRRQTGQRDARVARAALNRWLAIGLGAFVGIAIGIGVSLTTDVPFAPEIGALVGAGIGYTLARVVNSRW